MNKEKISVYSSKEHEVLAYWDENKIFEKSVRERPEGDPYVFYDGPPFATGLPHYGHIVTSVMKDVVPRYWTMRGKRVERVWGWDCHGLPIENIVQAKHNLKTSDDIEKFGICEFSEECRADVLTYADEWKKVVHRLGRWIEMDKPYRTMDLPFMESVWWVFKKLWDNDRIYEGRKPMHICPRCETVLSNFEVGQGYQDVKDISVTAKFKLLDGEYKNAYVLAWTTTPWTLPGNVLLAVGADIIYVVVEIDGEAVIVSKNRLDEVVKDKEYTLIKEIRGVDIVGSTYQPLFPVYENQKNAFRVVAADFVTTEEGTGIVHIAPGFGDDDMILGQKEEVDAIIHVKMNGHFVDELSEYLEKQGFSVAAVPVKEKGVYDKVDVQIIKYLASKGLLFAKQKFEHSYPHCWRCDTPLLNYSTSSWFVKVDDSKEELLRANDEIHWVPDTMKQGRFGKWLEGARDWAISRSRYWGTPLPIWRSEDGSIIVVGSKEELEELSGQKIQDLHKHVVDTLVINKDGKEYKRIPEVLDCWFESGSMPFAHLHYPFENKEKFDRGFPAEFIAEGQDQTRGWFYTLHVLSNAIFQMPAFKNVIVNGIVLAEDGKKMSKRLKNYPDPMEVMERYGSDAVRYYLMSSPVVHADNIRFNERDVDEVSKKFINILHNILSFYSLYSEFDDKTINVCEQGLERDGIAFKSFKEMHVLDRWIIARLQETLTEQTEAMENYELQPAARVLQGFVTDFSTWYIRRSRDRMKVDGADRTEALAVLRFSLDIFSKMIAPFMPF
ncbi:isoleucine--tRNA ligase, partial [Patescibacteria group bacterium]|nr:isoleucine--tRNA ligase [Patescibacteria group bacterium]